MTTGRSLALLVFLLAPQISKIDAWAQSQGSPVVIGETVHLQSNTLKETRSLLISKPAGYDNDTDRYPVLYLLDGETHFHYTTGIVSFLAENDRIPKMLLVGIVSGGRARRTHDLTPPSVAEIDNRFSPGNGGADAFLSFIADEVIPFVDKTYRTRPYRMLVGHSFGGLFGIYALITKPKLFSAYIAADPSLYWALSRNSTGGLFYGPFAGFTAFSIIAALRLRGAAASPDPRKANTTSMRLCPILSDVVGLYPFQIRIYH